MNMRQQQADFLYCEAIIKKHSKSFYYAFSQLPEEKAQAVYALYAFCRIADDSVDENPTTASRVLALSELQHELELFERGKEVNKPLWRALRVVFNQYDMDIEPFYDQIRGQELDVSFSRPQTMQELEQYSYYVAGSVGLMLLPIIASEYKSDIKQEAVDLGVAMQITNVLRDIGEDFYEKNRIYVPEEEMKLFGYTEDDLANGVVNASFIQLWEKLAERADILYAQFSKRVRAFDDDSRGPVILSALVYQGILDSVRENEYDCLSTRNYVNKNQMAAIQTSISH